MPRLRAPITAPARPRIRFLGCKRDAGGVAVIVGILLSTGVLMGMAALAVDVGRLYAEREELQSGADGVATAVALACARRQPGCAGWGSLATEYANANAKDNATAVPTVCGSAPQTPGALPGCDPGAYPDTLANCIGSLPPNTRGYVEVHTATQQTAGDDEYLLPYTFAQTITGDTGAAVGACSRVAWGAPTTGVALTVCTEEFNDATNNGTNLAPAPPTVPDASYEVKLTFHNGSNGGGNGGGPGGGGPGGGGNQDPLDPCEAGPPGSDTEGDFGWLDGIEDTCTALIVASTGTPRPGNAPGDMGQECQEFLQNARTNHTVIALPIYTRVPGSGNNASYELHGTAGFVITGYRLTGGIGNAPSNLPGSDLSCTPPDTCLMGYFTAAVVPTEDWTGEFGPGQALGASIIKTVG